MLPRIDNVQYYTRVTYPIDQHNFHECDLDQNGFHKQIAAKRLIEFSGKKIMPIVSLNAKNDIVYLQRYSSETSQPLTNASPLWLILKMQL